MKTIARAISIFALTLCVGTNLQAKGKGGKGGKGKKTDPVETYLKLNDKNKDGSIEKSEAHMGDETFAKWDKNKDGKLDKGELGAMLHVPKKK